MNGRIFLLDGDDLRPMDEQPYDSEDLLQRLLAEHPDLLAGDQIDETDPRRWLLVQRELGVPDREDGNDRWSIDHLFLDQDGIPTLVEVKRSSDTRIRREVVGQLLDCAAHAVVHWPVATIRDALAARSEPDETTICLPRRVAARDKSIGSWSSVPKTLKVPLPWAVRSGCR